MPKKVNQWRVEVTIRREFVDSIRKSLLGEIADLDVTSVKDVHVVSV